GVTGAQRLQGHRAVNTDRAMRVLEVALIGREIERANRSGVALEMQADVAVRARRARERHDAIREVELARELAALERGSAILFRQLCVQREVGVEPSLDAGEAIPSRLRHETAHVDRVGLERCLDRKWLTLPEAGERLARRTRVDTDRTARGRADAERSGDSIL